jgi:hypothetical protein
MPSRGERIYGQPPSPTLDLLFRLFLFGIVVAGLGVAGTATPIYRREWFLKYGFDKFAWFNYAEAAFGFVLIMEFCIKVIADGFIFTPNGYLLNLWNCVDGLILLASIVNIVDSLSASAGLYACLQGISRTEAHYSRTHAARDVPVTHFRWRKAHYRRSNARSSIHDSIRHLGYEPFLGAVV